MKGSRSKIMLTSPANEYTLRAFSLGLFLKFIAPSA
jgi:hypothetical protein